MADDDPGEEGNDRAVELSAIAAIYPELVIQSDIGASQGDRRASLNIQIDLVRPISIQTPLIADGAAPDRTEEKEAAPHPREGAQETHELLHLPPLNLDVFLPQGYPTKRPPIIRLSTPHSWLAEDKLKDLEHSVDRLWEDGGREQVLFDYIDHLREAAKDAFGLQDVLQVSPDLKVILLDFDLKAKRAQFERETFECGVCLGESRPTGSIVLRSRNTEPKKGSACHRLLLCSHVFCVGCLQDFYNACVTEGDVGSVKCPAPNCSEQTATALAKDAGGPQRTSDRTLEPSELLQIPLEQETVQRYIKLKRKKQLESDRTTVYCPRQWCQGPARAKLSTTAPNSANTVEDNGPQSYNESSNSPPLPPPADRLAICQDCTFAFCLVCKASWHGEYYTCFPRSQFELTAEERASEEYMKLHTQPCPTCDARAQKTHGCNHMICFRCDTHFCYLCGAYLERSNPYEHFNNKFKGCYMRLWELEGGDDGQFGHEFAGGGVGAMVDWETDDADEAGDELFAAGAAEVAPPAPAPPPLPPAPAAAPPVMLAHARPVANDARPAIPREGGAYQRQRQQDPERDGAGLRRFLEMVRDDIEDEWDSDEMSGDDDDEMEELEG